MGAWIETDREIGPYVQQCVAPYVGAWIETIEDMGYCVFVESHLTWVRGLKLYQLVFYSLRLKSHLTWVRGWKLIVIIF